MSSRRLVLCVVTAYLLTASLGIVAWLGSRAGAMPPLWVLLLGLSPALLYLALGFPARGRSEFLGRSMACLGLPPVLLLMWAASSADDVVKAPSAEGKAAEVSDDGAAQALGEGLDAARLFDGAVSTSDVPLQLGGIVLARRAVFSDGSELALYRFESAVHAGAYLSFLSGTRSGVPSALANRKGTRLAPQGARYVYVEQHGRELLQIDAQDAAQAQSRLTAQQVHAPKITGALVAQASAAASTSAQATAQSAAPLWPFVLSFCILHACAFVGFVFWAGTHSTRVAPAAGAVPVREGRLRARLNSLQELGVPFAFASSERADELVVEYRFDPGSERRHHVFLVIDGQNGEVRVRERTNTVGAAPKNQHERDMRPIAGPRFDPTRPEAQKVWGRVAQTSILEPELLSAVPLTLHEDRAELPSDYAQRLDTDQMIYVLCAVVTRSGFSWCPVFLS